MTSVLRLSEYLGIAYGKGLHGSEGHGLSRHDEAGDNDALQSAAGAIDRPLVREEGELDVRPHLFDASDPVDVDFLNGNRFDHRDAIAHGIPPKPVFLVSAPGSIYQHQNRYPATQASRASGCIETQLKDRFHPQPVNPRPPVHDYGFTVRKRCWL